MVSVLPRGLAGRGGGGVREMVQVAIVEDEKSAAQELEELVKSYFREKQRDCVVYRYESALYFFDAYRADLDLVFMDIDMPDIDGMSAAARLRRKDELVLLVFVTNMRQYAVKGYAVNALDFIIKPPVRATFFPLMDKVQRILDARTGADISVKTAQGMYRVAAKDIRYIEVRRHRLFFYTEQGDFEAWGNLRDIEKRLPQRLFSRCNMCYLVGLAHIRGIEGEEVLVGADRLKISRPRRKEFLAEVAQYFGSVR